MRPSAFGSFNLLKLHGEFSYLLSKIDNGLISPHFMSLLKGQAPRLIRFSFILPLLEVGREGKKVISLEKGSMEHAKGGMGRKEEPHDLAKGA